MQGLQTGLQAASTLGQLGQTQYGQQMGINQLQAQYGGQQQALQQQGLTQAYGDFQNQQNYLDHLQHLQLNHLYYFFDNL
jgi:hypothetical protein